MLLGSIVPGGAWANEAGETPAPYSVHDISATAGSQPPGREAVPEARLRLSEQPPHASAAESATTLAPPTIEPVPAISNRSQVRIRGTAAPGSTVTAYVYENPPSQSEPEERGSTTANEQGQYELLPSFDDGRYELFATTELNAEVSERSASVVFEVDTTPPGDSYVEWVNVAYNEIWLSWEPPYVENEQGIPVPDPTVVGYRLERTDGTLLTEANQHQYVDRGLPEESYIDYKLYAIDRAGNRSGGTTVQAATFHRYAVAVNDEPEMISMPVISRDGKTVAFLGVDVYDVETRERTVVPGSEDTYGYLNQGLALSGDGRYVAFESASGTESALNVHDRTTGQTTAIVSGGGARFHSLALSGDGSKLAFVSSSDELTPGDANGLEDVFLADLSDLADVRIKRLSAGPAGQNTTSASGEPAISGDGKFAVFVSQAPELVPGGAASGSVSRLFLYDIAAGALSHIPIADSSEGAPVLGILSPSLSSDGRYIAFKGQFGDKRLAVYDRQTGTDKAVWSGSSVSGLVFERPHVSDDGNYVAVGYRLINPGHFTAPFLSLAGGIRFNTADGSYRHIGKLRDRTADVQLAGDGNRALFAAGGLNDPKNLYVVCFEECADTPSGQGIDRVQWSVAAEAWVSGELKPGTVLTIRAAGQTDSDVEAVVSYLEAADGGAGDPVRKEARIDLAELSPGLFGGSFTVAERIAGIDSIAARPKNGGREARAEQLPVKIAGKLAVDIQTGRGDLLGDAELVATGGFWTQHIPLTASVVHYEAFLPGGTYQVALKSKDGEWTLASREGVAIRHGEATAVAFSPVFPASLTVKVTDADRSLPLPAVPVRFKKPDGEIVYEGRTNDSGEATLPGEHFAGEQLVVGVTPSDEYVPLPDQTVTLGLGTKRLAFPLRRSDSMTFSMEYSSKAGSPKLSLPVLDSNAYVKVKGQPGLSLKARIRYERWVSEQATEIVSQDIDLPADATGTYTGVFPIAEGMAMIESVQLQVDGVWLGKTYPVRQPVAGRFLIHLDVPEDAGWRDPLAGGTLSGYSFETGERRYSNTVPIRPETMTYVLEAPFAHDQYNITLSPPGSAAIAFLRLIEKTPQAGRTRELTMTPEFAVTIDGRARGPAGEQVSYRYELWNDGNEMAASGQAVESLRIALKSKPNRPYKLKLIPFDPIYATRTIDTVVDKRGVSFETVFEKKTEARLSGRVLGVGGQPAAYAIVTATVKQDGLGKTYTATADAGGVYAMSVPAGEAELRASGNGGTGAISPRTVVQAAQSDVSVPDLQLMEYAKLFLKLYTKSGGNDWQGPLGLDWTTFYHFWITSSPGITEIGQPSRVAAVAGETVRVCANGREAGLPAACAETVIGANNEAELELRLENAGGEVLFAAVGPDGTAVRSARVDLYRQADNTATNLYPNADPASSKFRIPVTSPGGQRLIVYANGLYGAVEFTARPGEIVDLGTIRLGAANLFHGSANGISAASEWAVPGGSMKLRAYYGQVGSIAAVAGNARLVLQLPEGLDIVPGTGVLNGTGAAPVQTGRTLEVPLGDVAFGQSGSFQVQLRAAGAIAQPNLSVQAGIRYRLDEAEKEEWIGTAVVETMPATLRAPALTPKPDIKVSGNALAGADVTVYDGGAAIGRTTASPAGTWNVPVALVDNDRTKHRLQVGVRTGDVSMAGQQSVVVYDPNDPGLDEVSMLQGDARRIDFRPDNGVAVFPYVVVPGRPFQFSLTFRDPDRVYDVSVRVGDSEAQAFRSGDRFGAVVPFTNNLGPVWVSYKKKPDPIPPGGPPSEEELRDQAPEGFRNFALEWAAEGGERAPDGTVVPEGAIRGRVKLSDDLAANVEVTGTVLDSYVPSAEEEAKVRKTGIPVYDASVQRYVGEKTISMSVTATIPVSALSSSDAAALGLSESKVATLAAGGAVKATYKVVMELLNQTLGARDVVVNAKGLADDNNLFKRARRAAEAARRLCDPRAREYYTQYAEELRTTIYTQERHKLALGVAGTAKGTGWLGVGFWAATYKVGLYLDGNVSEQMDELERLLKQYDNNVQCRPISPELPDADPVYIWDPSGYVYEGVPANRVEDVQSTVLQRNAETGQWDVWDAGWFGQLNPQLTDAQGRYGWDVPPGRWKVKYEKDGYETAYSGEMDVPPPHFDVNVPLASYLPPGIDDVTAAPGGTKIEMFFDRPIDAGSLEADAVSLRSGDGAPVEGAVEPIDPVDADGKTLAMAVAFVPAAPLADGATYTVRMSGKIISYAGIPLGEDAERAVTVRHRDTTPPSPVSGLAGSRSGESAIFAWEEPNERDLAAVRLRWKKETDAQYGEAREIASGTRWAAMEGLDRYAGYDFSVAAVDASGNESAPVLWKLEGASAEADTTPPGPVANLAVKEALADRLTIGWDDPEAPDLAFVRIVWAPEGDATRLGGMEAAAGAGKATIAGLERSKDYTLAVSTVDKAGNESSPLYLKARTSAESPDSGNGGGGGPIGGGAPGGGGIPSPSGRDETVVRLSAEGGDYTWFEGRLRLRIPAGAAEDGTELKAERLADPIRPPGPEWIVASSGYRLTVGGSGRFTKPGVLEIGYDPAAIGDRDPRKLGVYRADPARPGNWIYAGGAVDPRAGVIAASIAESGAYVVMLADLSFVDMANHWAEADIELLASRHLVDGTGAGRFEPDRSVTRAEFAKLALALVRAAAQGQPQPPAGEALAFSDVAADAWYADTVREASARGLVEGADGSFRPNDPVTREETMVIIARALGVRPDIGLDAGTVLSRFDDGADVSEWARLPVAYLVQAGLVQGSGSALRPADSTTRAEAATLMARMLNASGELAASER